MGEDQKTSTHPRANAPSIELPILARFPVLQIIWSWILFDFRYTPKVYQFNAILRYILAIPHAPMIVGHNKTHNQSAQDSQASLLSSSLSQFPLHLFDAIYDRNVWQPQAVFQPLFSTAASFVLFQVGLIANQSAAARTTLIHAPVMLPPPPKAATQNSKTNSWKLKLKRPACTIIFPGVFWCIFEFGGTGA